MGYIGDLTTGTETERAVYARALGTVLALGASVRDVKPLNDGTWLYRWAVRWGLA